MVKLSAEKRDVYLQADSTKSQMLEKFKNPYREMVYGVTNKIVLGEGVQDAGTIVYGYQSPTNPRIVQGDAFSFNGSEEIVYTHSMTVLCDGVDTDLKKASNKAWETATAALTLSGIIDETKIAEKNPKNNFIEKIIESVVHTLAKKGKNTDGIKNILRTFANKDIQKMGNQLLKRSDIRKEILRNQAASR